MWQHAFSIIAAACKICWACIFTLHLVRSCTLHVSVVGVVVVVSCMLLTEYKSSRTNVRRRRWRRLLAMLPRLNTCCTAFCLSNLFVVVVDSFEVFLLLSLLLLLSCVLCSTKLLIKILSSYLELYLLLLRLRLSILHLIEQNKKASLPIRWGIW